LRKQSVLTFLSAAGVVLSAAGLAVVIGIGRVQIQSSRGGSGDLFADPWFDMGLFLGVAAIILGVIAICANVTQGKALKEFPLVSMEMLGWSSADTEHELIPGGPRVKVTLVRYTVRFISNEASRNASLSPVLWWKLRRGAPQGLAIWMLTNATWEIDAQTVGGVIDPPHPLPLPVRLMAGEAIQGDLYFEAWEPMGEFLDRNFLPWFEITDHFSGRVVSFDAAISRKHDHTNWTPK
jgi:hypothetical protein